VDARDDDLVTLDMPVRIWAGIDAGVDNAVSSAAVNGDEAAVEVGQRIREAPPEHPIYEELGDDESARLGRDALAVIEGIDR
jgi:hypothetical protein